MCLLFFGNFQEWEMWLYSQILRCHRSGQGSPDSERMMFDYTNWWPTCKNQLVNLIKTSNKSGYAGVYKQLLAGLETKSAMTWSENHNVIWINGRPYMYNPRDGSTNHQHVAVRLSWSPWRGPFKRSRRQRKFINRVRRKFSRKIRRDQNGKNFYFYRGKIPKRFQ